MTNAPGGSPGFTRPPFVSPRNKVVPLDDGHYLAGDANSRTNQIYDRRSRQVTRNIVERLSCEVSSQDDLKGPSGGTLEDA